MEILTSRLEAQTDRSSQSSIDFSLCPMEILTSRLEAQTDRSSQSSIDFSLCPMEFLARGWRHRLKSMLLPPQRRLMSNNVKPVPDGYHSVTPYLIVRGVAKLIDFL